MVVQLSTAPIGSSSGGFSYAFDPTLGTFRRASSSFGPLFAERAATIGRGRFSAGFNYQHSSYDRFEGSNLDDGSIKFYLRHQECCTTAVRRCHRSSASSSSPTARSRVRSSRET